MSTLLLKKTPVYWLLPALLAILVAPVCMTVTTADSAFYLEKAIDIYTGNGYSYLQRGPVLPAIFSLFFKVMGPSVVAAIVVMRLFFVGSIILLSILAARLFNPTVGLGAGLLLVLSNYLFFVTARISIDPVYPFFVFLGILGLFNAYQSNSYKWSVLAGASLGLAFLTKEVTLLFLPLPFLSWLLISQFRTAPLFRQMIVQSATIATVILPWVLYVWNTADSLTPLLGGAHNASPLETFFSPWKIATLLGTYYQEYFTSRLALAPLFIAGWAFVFFKAWRTPGAAILALLFILFLPVVISQGAIHVRWGQNAVLYGAGYIALSYTLFSFSHWAAPRCKTTPITIFVSLLLIASVGQLLLGNPSTAKLWSQQTTAVRLMTGKSTDWHVRGTLSEDAKEAAVWLTEHAPSGSNVLADYSLFRSLYFYTQGAYTFSRIPYTSIEITPFTTLPQVTRHSGKQTDNLLYLWSSRREDSLCTWQTEPCLYLRALYEAPLREHVVDADVSYVVLGQRNWFLHEYFDVHPGYILRTKLTPEIHIYEVKDAQGSPAFPLRTGAELSPLLKNVETVSPDALKALRTELFPQHFKISREFFDLVYQGNAPHTVPLAPAESD